MYNHSYLIRWITFIKEDRTNDVLHLCGVKEIVHFEHGHFPHFYSQIEMIFNGLFSCLSFLHTAS